MHKAWQGIKAGWNRIRVFRVEGPGNTRILVDPNGNVTIPDHEPMLHLTFGQEERAKEFLKQRLPKYPDDEIRSFEVPESVVNKIRKDAIKQSEVRNLGKDRPQIDDPSMGPDQYDLPPKYIKLVEDNIIPGSGQ